MTTHLDPALPMTAGLRIQEETGDLTVSFRRRRSKGTIVFFAVWLLIWTGVGVSAIGDLRTASARGAAFLLVWLCGWALGECVAGGVVAWQFCGRERLTVTRDELEVREGLGRFSLTKRYEAALVRDVTPARAPHGDGQSRSDFCLRVSYDDDDVHIGQGMSQREAEYVASAVLSRIGGQRRWWSGDDEPRPDGAPIPTTGGATHVYRPQETEHGPLARLLLAAGNVVFFALVVGGPVAWVVWAWHQGPGDAVVPVVVSLFIWRAAYSSHYLDTCREIRLSDDGRCELHAERRVVHLGAGQITSVRDGTDDGEAGYQYLILFEGGKMTLHGDWPDFGDFVARLKAISPYVDLTGWRARRGRCRADELREMLETARREARKSEGSRR